jgi:hypothetical protein
MKHIRGISLFHTLQFYFVSLRRIFNRLPFSDRPSIFQFYFLRFPMNLDRIEGNMSDEGGIIGQSPSPGEPSTIISFDIGIKNMCYCILQPEPFTIIDWNILNLLEDPETFQQTVIPLCSTEIRSTPHINGLLHYCTKKAKYFKQGSSVLYYCQKHAKTSNYFLPSKQFTKGFLNKMKKPDLITYCHSKLLFVDSISKEPLDMLSKPDLVKSALYYLKNNSLVSISEKNPKIKVSGNTDLVEIGWNMKKHLDKIPDSTLKNIKYVIIENQISPIANRMKTIQGMLAQYFMMRCGSGVRIEFVSSKNKLRDSPKRSEGKSRDSPKRSEGEDQFSGIHRSEAKEKENYYLEENEEKKTEISPMITEKQKYKQNKNDAIAYCSDILDKNENLKKEWGWTMKMVKKDDYADCFLQGYWYMNQFSGTKCR